MPDEHEYTGRVAPDELPTGWADVSGLYHELERSVMASELAPLAHQDIDRRLHLYACEQQHRSKRRALGLRLDYEVSVSTDLDDVGATKRGRGGCPLHPTVQLDAIADDPADAMAVAERLGGVLVRMLGRRAEAEAEVERLLALYDTAAGP